MGDRLELEARPVRRAWVGDEPPHKLKQQTQHRKSIHAVEAGRNQPFSWTRCLVSLVSYTLLLSDVFRSGVGIRQVPTQYPVLHPDVFSTFGPYAYPIIHLTTANATSDAFSGFWSYKYDTTSIAMRAVAQHLQLPTWSSCVLYKERCLETAGLSFRTVFTMIDSLIEAVAIRNSTSRSGSAAKRSSGHLTLRTTSEYKDRLHHYALPWFFEHVTKRTTQAIHFKYNHPASGPPPRAMCDARQPRPHSCDEMWTNHVYGICGYRPHPPCSKTLWTDIPQRLDALLKSYPNHTIDFIVLDSTDDMSRGGFTFQGRKYFDIVTLARVRKCEPIVDTDSSSLSSTCTTVAVDDFRYESASFTMDAPSWFPIVAALRAIGQMYMWLRILLLCGGCFAIHTSPSQRHKRPFASRLVASVRTLFLIPSQVVVYGSRAPLLAYTVAHLIDSPATYELVATTFDSFLGILQINIGDFLRQCAVSMRTVWTLSLLCQVALAVRTHCAWSPIHGVPGIPEFSISVVASATIFAQYRLLQFRSTRVLQIQEVVPNARRALGLRTTTDATHGSLHHLLFGSAIDVQCLTCILLALAAITVMSWLLNRVLPRFFRYRITLITHTLVPYSAGMLWLRSQLVTSWCSPILRHRTKSKPSFALSGSVSKGHTIQKTPLRDALFTSFVRSRRLSNQRHDAAASAIAMPDTGVSALIQYDMHSVDKRSREGGSLVALVNLAVMTDPLTFLRLRVFSGSFIGVYESILTRRRFLLPRELQASDADIPIDWSELQLVAVVNSRDLEWRDLLCCG